MIPRTLHFCYFGGFARLPSFPLTHFLSIRSAIHFLEPEQVLFHHDHEPRGPYWDELKPLLTLVPCAPPKEVFGRPLRHPAHQADVARLQVLLEHGGAYFDVDTVCLRPFDDLFAHPSVLGLQRGPRGKIDGLASGVILAEAGNSFLQEWLDAYRNFRSSGLDEHWDELSVRTPMRLAQIDRNGSSPRSDLHVEPPESFYEPSYNSMDLKILYERVADYPAAYCYHLWNSYAYKRYLEPLTERLIREVDTTYNLAARPFLPNVQHKS